MIDPRIKQSLVSLKKALIGYVLDTLLHPPVFKWVKYYQQTRRIFVLLSLAYVADDPKRTREVQAVLLEGQVA